jgi:glycosyltransferase involved in cell wall biosynthesis
MQNKAKLTIAIPTYNRAAKLQAQLQRLAPQLNPQVFCCVYDNASTDETKNIVNLFKDASYYCTECNFGGLRNFLRCFENCKTEWLWILADDDPIGFNAVEKILALIEHNACDFIHTSPPTVGRHDADVTVADINQLLKHTTLSSLLWISSGIYKMPSFQPLLWLFVYSISTCGSQMVMVFKLLESRGGTVLLSPVSILTEEPEAHWSSLDFIIRFSHLPEYLAQPEHQKLVAEKIWLEVYQWALLLGLRETGQPEQIEKWQRIQKLTLKNLKAYHARPLWIRTVRNLFRTGYFRKSLVVLYYAFLITLLGRCPIWFFRHLLKMSRLPKSIRKQLPRIGKEIYKRAEVVDE